MNLLKNIKEWNVKMKYLHAGVALANLLDDPLEPEEDPFFLEMVSLIKKEKDEVELKYLELGYEKIDFDAERKKLYEGCLSTSDVKYLVRKKTQSL